ncbi:MAG: OmpA family protein [Bacteroidota bacterium]
MNTHLKWLALLCLVLSGLPRATAQDYVLEKINASVNTDQYDEIAPCVSEEGNMLYFTRVGHPEFEHSLIEDGHDLHKTLSSEAYSDRLRQIFSILDGETVFDPVHSGFNQDIWVARSVNDVYDQVYHPGYPLNNALPNSISTLMPSGHEMIVINQFAADGGMKKGFSSIVQGKNGEWSFPEAIQIDNYHNSGPDVNLTLSADGRTLILAMEREDASGKSDLYVSFRKGDNSWSMPQNLGPYINTPYRETTPFLCKDMKTLFYASDRGNNSAGGSDIFMQTRLDDSWKLWSAPKRFRYPVNSRSNDSHPYFNETTGHLYFTSNRDGSSDIFRIQIEEPEPVGVEISGVVLNAETMEPVAADVLKTLEFGDAYEYFPSTNKGEFRLVVPTDQAVVLKAVKQDYEGVERKVSIDEAEDRITLLLKPLHLSASILDMDLPVRTVALGGTPPEMNLKEGDRIALAPIYFAQSKAIVLKQSYSELNELARILKKYPNIYIRISGHTDNQGEEASLLKLSTERAESIKEYLVYKKHIKPVRIQTVGHGGNRPVNDNSSEVLRKQNRRVEIEVIHVGTSFWPRGHGGSSE